MRSELKRLQRELGISFIHVTHSQDEALSLADQIIVMNKGRIEQVGSAQDVFNKPQTQFVAQFMGGHNVMRDGQSYLAIRADKVQISKTSSKDGAGLSAVVREIEYLGTTFSVGLDEADASVEGVQPDKRHHFRCPLFPRTFGDWPDGLSQLEARRRTPPGELTLTNHHQHANHQQGE